MRNNNVRLIGVPLGLGAGRRGAEGGQGAIRQAGLMAQLDALGYKYDDIGIIGVPEVASDALPADPRARFLVEIATVCADLARVVRETLELGSRPLVLGGDHSIAAGTVAGVSSYLRGRGEKMGIVWIDAHADMNTPEVSPSGNVHGMSLAASLGLGVPELTHLEGFSPKLKHNNVSVVAARDLDRDEVRLIREMGVHVFTMRDIDSRGMFSVMNEAIERASDGTAGVHVSLDMDALDPSIAPGTGTTVPGGLTYREAHLALEMLADTGAMISLECVEVNPTLDPEGHTARLAVGLIASALGKDILHRMA